MRKSKAFSLSWTLTRILTFLGYLPSKPLPMSKDIGAIPCVSLCVCARVCTCACVNVCIHVRSPFLTSCVRQRGLHLDNFLDHASPFFSPLIYGLSLSLEFTVQARLSNQEAQWSACPSCLEWSPTTWVIDADYHHICHLSGSFWFELRSSCLPHQVASSVPNLTLCMLSYLGEEVTLRTGGGRHY